MRGKKCGFALVADGKAAHRRFWGALGTGIIRRELDSG